MYEKTEYAVKIRFFFQKKFDFIRDIIIEDVKRDMSHFDLKWDQKRRINWFVAQNAESTDSLPKTPNQLIRRSKTPNQLIRRFETTN